MDDSGAQKSKILVIEDNSGDIQLLELALQHAQLNYELKIFQLGGEALAFVRQSGAAGMGTRPDLAIIDLNLPQNDGLEILEAMRGSAMFANVPVAVFTSSSLPREQARLEALQVRQYIKKPADLDEMLQVGLVLRDLLEESRLSGRSAGAYSESTNSLE